MQPLVSKNQQIEAVTKLFHKELSQIDGCRLLGVSKEEYDKLLSTFIEGGRAALEISRKDDTVLDVQARLWNKGLFSHSHMPPILISEYKRLYALWSQGQHYGVLLQVKDVYEILLKLPVLLYLGIWKETESETIRDSMLKVGYLLLSRPPSLGQWETAARIIEAQSADPTDERQMLLLPVLKDVIRMFGTGKGGLSIVNWRNEKIGHGALSIVSESYTNDLNSKIEHLTRHLTLFEPQYSQMEINVEDGEARLFIKEKEVQAKDYIINLESESYLFDSLKSRKQMPVYLNYSDGSKYIMKNEGISLFYEMIANRERASLASESHEIDKEIIASREEAVFQSLSVSDYIEPTYLVDWVDSYMSHYSRGILLLQMEEGMGKSTFVRGLDELSIGSSATLGVNAMIRAYYINNAYRHRTDLFKSETIDLLQHLIVNGEKIKLKGTVSFSNIDNRSADLCLVLSAFQQTYYERTGKEKLLFIIDSIDEIPEGNQDSVLDYIPKSEELPEGVYILLTGRTNAELTNHMLKKLDDLKVYEEGRRQVTIADPLYIAVIESYLSQSTGNSKFLLSMLQGLEPRFIHVQALKWLDKEPSPTAMDPISLMNAYLSRLEHSYGTKYFRQLTKVIAILSTCNEALSLSELVALMGEDKVELAHLSYLIDLRGWIRIERSSRGNLYSISNDSIRTIFQHRAEITEQMSEFIPQWLEAFSEMSNEEVINNPAYVYIAAYWLKDARKFGGQVSEENVKEYLERLKTFAVYLFCRARNRMEQLRCIETMKRLIEENRSEDFFYYHYTIAESLVLINSYEEALKYNDIAKKLSFKSRYKSDSYMKCLNLEAIICKYLPLKPRERRNGVENYEVFLKLYRKNVLTISTLLRVRLVDLKSLRINTLDALWVKYPISEDEEIWKWKYSEQEVINAFANNQLERAMSIVEQSLVDIKESSCWPSLRLRLLEADFLVHLTIIKSKIYDDFREKQAIVTISQFDNIIMPNRREGEASLEQFTAFQREARRYCEIFDNLWAEQAALDFKAYLTILFYRLEAAVLRNDVLEEVELRNRIRFFLKAEVAELTFDTLKDQLENFIAKEAEMAEIPIRGVDELLGFWNIVFSSSSGEIPFTNTNSFLRIYKAAEIANEKERLMLAYYLIVAKQTMIDHRKEVITAEWVILLEEFLREGQSCTTLAPKYIAIGWYILVLWESYLYRYDYGSLEKNRDNYRNRVINSMGEAFHWFKSALWNKETDEDTILFFQTYCKLLETLEYIWLPRTIELKANPIFDLTEMNALIEWINQHKASSGKWHEQ